MCRTTKKQAILNAAEKLFAKQGYAATSTAEIAREARVAEGLIFHHFGCKCGMLLQIFDRMFEELNEAARVAIDSALSGREGLEAFIHSHFKFLQEQRTRMGVSVQDLPGMIGESEEGVHCAVRKRTGERIGMIEECLNKGALDGTLRKVHAGHTAIIIGSNLFGLTHFALRHPVKMPPIEKDFVEFVTRSLKT